jgi:hypothetical protein
MYKEIFNKDPNERTEFEKMALSFFVEGLEST